MKVKSQTQKQLAARQLVKRPGAVLICVLVVLLIVGLLMSQTIQTLLLVRRGDDQRQSLRQARELLELGEIVLRQHAQELPEGELTVALVASQSKSVAAADKPLESASNNFATGIIYFERLSIVQPGDKPVRITARYGSKETYYEATQ